MAARHRRGFLLRLLGDHRLGGDEEARHGGGVLQRRAHHLGGVDHALLDQIPIFTRRGVVAEGIVALVDDLAGDHGAVLARILGDLARRRLQSAADDADADPAARLELAAGEVTARRVAQALGNRRLLLVLDTCEHVVDAAAQFVEAVLRAGATVRIIATSREPLRAEGEQVYPVPALAVPAGEGDDPWDYGAVRLFALRSRETGARTLDDRRIVAAMAAICRQLDGIPLAIELAAARASTLGIAELATYFADRFSLLTGGRRTALPRHRTLRAALDWSFDLLPDHERAILLRLAVLAGAFSLAAATAVAAGGEMAPPDVVIGVTGLVAKSLVATAADGSVARYRLLDTTRAYALEKLVESGEADAIRRRHAEHFRDLLQAAAEDKDVVRDWPAAYAAEIDNIRAALAWAFGPGGDVSIGVSLAAASVPIWFEMSWLTECRGWTEKALGADGAVDLQPKSEMVLQCAYGYSLMDAQGWSDRARAALLRASELAEGFRNVDYQLRTLAGLAVLCTRVEDFHGALALGRRAEAIANASADPIAIATADWSLGVSLHLLGEYDEALAYAQRAAHATAAAAVRRTQTVRLGRDIFLLARGTAALILWAQGLPDQSARAALEILAEAESGGVPLSLCLALTWCGCVISFWLGDLETAERSVVLLKEHAARHDLSSYGAYGLGFEGQLFAARGDIVAGERLLRACLDRLRQAKSEGHYTAFLSALAEVLAAAGRFDDSLAAADEAVLRTERGNALWWMPEALRIKGEAVLSCKGDTKAAEDHFRRSLDLANRQGALSWELRAVTSLARLRRDTGGRSEARDLLASVYGRFTEGFGTADLQAAKALLDELAG